jgi:amino acid adenylation domain-containing protein
MAEPTPPPLNPEKQRLLERRLKGLSRPPAERQSIPRRPDQGPAPLSFAQRQMWLLDQLIPGNPAYNLPVGYYLRGRINVDALEAAFAEVIRRHEILRTTFELRDGEIVQVPHASLEFRLKVMRFDHLPAAARTQTLHEFALNESVKHFDIARLPLIRAFLIRWDESEHVLLLNLHHIVADGGGVLLLLNELSVAYRAFDKDEKPELPALPIQYTDFAVWERQQAAAGKREEQLQFWMRRLGGNLPVLQLPEDRPRPGFQSFKGSNVWFDLPASLCASLQALAREQGATFFMAILACFQAILHRYSGAVEIIVGAPVANRNAGELQSLIGNFLNMVALRCDLSGDPPFRQLLRQARDVALNAFSNQDVPFEQVVERLQFQRDPRRNAIFQAMLQILPRRVPEFAGLEVRDFHFDLGFAQFDLSLHLYETAEGYAARFEYCSDLFSHERVQRLAAHFLNFLRGALADPDLPVSRVPILTDAEITMLERDWNATARDYPREACVHRLFEAQVARSPSAIAVVFQDESLTFHELNQRADHLAARLKTLGVGPNVPVGLCIERSAEMVVGILGILKAGGAYVPIDPEYPRDRIGFVLEDSQASVLVTQRRLREKLPTTFTRLLCVDEAPGGCDMTQRAMANPTSMDLAYVIYTSGSTGRPKGVQIEHRSLVNFLHSMLRRPGFAGDDVILAVTTLSFDIAGLELYLPLISGAKVVIAPRRSVADGEALLQLMKSHGVTILQATPATWRLLIAAGLKGSPRLKALCGGEALPQDLAAELLPRCSELWNMYGPTETTIWSSCARVTSATDIHIGRPIDNTEMHVLNAGRQPQPVGVAGELFIGGEGLARGYHNRPELNAEKFIVHPFKPGRRLYRTGDLARWRSDGNVECLGRLDFQVKVRGLRIELGEIESQLATHGKVKQAIVTAREDIPGDKRLVGYVVPRFAEEPPKADELREHLRRQLPDYMVPSSFVQLDELPLTPNGKIDRKALSARSAGAPVSSRQIAPPRNSTERRVRALFESALRTPVASVKDSFFDLGGHSIIAANLMLSIEREFGRRLPLATLLLSPTVEGIAAALNPAREDSEHYRWLPLVAVQPRGTRPPLFLVHGAGGNVLLYRDLAQRLGDDQPLYGLQAFGLDGQRAPLSTVEEMAASYLPYIRRTQPRGPYYLGGYCMGGLVAYEMARRLVEEGEHVALLALLDTYNLSTLKEGKESSGRLVFQRLRFHLGNLAGLRLSEVVPYFREKVRIAREGEMAHVLSGLFGSGLRAGRERSQAPVESTVQQANDRAAEEFRPGSYTGRVTLFKPQVNYDTFSDADMGWGGVAAVIESVTLPVNPHAMLVEPFVRHLAGELQSRLSTPAMS